MQGGVQFPMPEFRPLGQGFIQGFSVVNLENLGREADSFAQHIIRRYDSLANYTVFAQVCPGRILFLPAVKLPLSASILVGICPWDTSASMAHGRHERGLLDRLLTGCGYHMR